MIYRVCKSFEIESGHMLMKHPDRCRHPHGHSRRVEVVIAAETLDQGDMVCDFSAIKCAVGAIVDRFDHALAVNSNDPVVPALRAAGAAGERLIEFPGQDPTTEVLARHIYDSLAAALASGREIAGPGGRSYRLAPGLRLERVRVTETSSTWAEYARA